MSCFELVENLHRTLQVLVIQQEITMGWIVVVIVQSIPHLGHEVLKLVYAESLLENPHFLKIVCVIWRLKIFDEN